MHTLHPLRLNGLLRAEPHIIWPPNMVTLAPTILTRQQSPGPTTPLWRLLVRERQCCSYPEEKLQSKMYSIFRHLNSARFSLFTWLTSQDLILYSTSHIQDHPVEILRELITSCIFWMVMNSYQLRHWLDTHMCFTPRGIRLSMLLLPQPWCPAVLHRCSIPRRNLLIDYSNSIYVLGILDSNKSNSWPRTQPLVLN